MAGLAQERMRKVETWKTKQFKLTSGTKAYKGGDCCLVLATGQVQPGAAGTGLVFIGMFAETIDATSAAQLVNVDLMREVTLEWLDNDTAGTPVSGTTGILGPCYILDDHTVTAVPTVNSLAGVVWAVDSAKGVAVERTMKTGDGLLGIAPALPAFAAGATAPAAIVSGAIYDVPTTAAASTITLPAASPDGTVAYFSADGTKNGNTVQYVDATGTTNLTPALTASKRHLVVVAKRGGKWFANAYVGP